VKSSDNSLTQTVSDSVIIAGGGIGGLVMALTLDQIGVPCLVLEQAPEIGPLGVGINLQPNAVRELFDLGINQEALEGIGVSCQEWALLGRNGRDIYSEPRGIKAGYQWPQFSLHRGRLQMLLLQTVVDRLGSDRVLTGHQVTGYEHAEHGVDVLVRVGGETHRLAAPLLLAADGIHSAVRAQMHPDQGDVHWGGAILWRGVTQGKPIRTGASFVGIGSLNHRFICYPISQADPETGLAEINWIAEITLSDKAAWDRVDWNASVSAQAILPYFSDWHFPWLDIPQMIEGAPSIFEYPMVDRDPVATWIDGPVALLGDAAHAMYPTGSNGASQAIVDARVLGAMILEHGLNEHALRAFDHKLCADISAVVLRNRGAGPFGLLGLVDDRCKGDFEHINEVISQQEMDDFMAQYKRAAGFAMETLNTAAPIIKLGAGRNHR